MSDNNGKIILSLLAGATAGVVAGLLLAPETGEETRNSFKKAAGDLGGDLNKFFQDSLGKLREATGTSTGEGPNEDAAVMEDRDAADSLFDSMNTAGTSGRSTTNSQTGDNAATAGL